MTKDFWSQSGHLVTLGCRLTQHLRAEQFRQPNYRLKQGTLSRGREYAAFCFWLMSCNGSGKVYSVAIPRLGWPENTHLLRKGKYHSMADLLFDWLGFSCFACIELDRYLQVWLNPNQSNRKSAAQLYFLFWRKWVFSGLAYFTYASSNLNCSKDISIFYLKLFLHCLKWRRKRLIIIRHFAFESPIKRKKRSRNTTTDFYRQIQQNSAIIYVVLDSGQFYAFY